MLSLLLFNESDIESEFLTRMIIINIAHEELLNSRLFWFKYPHSRCNGIRSSLTGHYDKSVTALALALALAQAAASTDF
jgi:hypothetical protein